VTVTIQSASVTRELDNLILVPVTRGSRADGAIVAAGVALGVTILAIAIGQVWGMALGIPAATVSGWLLAPRIRSDRRPFGTILSMAALTISIADAMVVIGFGVASVVGGSVPFGDVGVLELLASAAVFAVVTWLLGMILVGILSLFVTIPCATVWALIVRKLARQRQVV
jgi:hypothetical protein